MYYSDHMNGTDWAAMGLMMAFMLILVLVAVWAIAQWLRPADRCAPPAPPATPPREILDEGYARGEIDTDEYQERRRTLDQLPTH